MRLDRVACRLVRPRQRLVDVERGAGGAERVVVMRPRRAEQRHDGVPDVLVDRAAVADDDAVDERREAGNELAHLLRIKLLRQCGEPGDVGEQDGDWRRSPACGPTGSPAACAAAVPRSVIAASRRLRRPSEATPSSFKSASVSWTNTPKSMSFSAKRWAYSDIPSFSSQCSISCITTQHPAELMFLDPPDGQSYPIDRFARNRPKRCAAGSPGRHSSEHRCNAVSVARKICRTSSAAGRGPAGRCVSSGRPFFDRNLELAV
jgi:hypothetical protein